MKSRALYAACLVLFPVLLIVFAGTATGVHPDPSGETAVDQVRAVASSAGAWRLVHLVLAGASLLGIGACLSPSNEPFLGEFADASWNSIPYLGYTAGSLRLRTAYRGGRDQGVSGFGWSSPSTQMSARSL
jgi:hypothetical protein